MKIQNHGQQPLTSTSAAQGADLDPATGTSRGAAAPAAASDAADFSSELELAQKATAAATQASDVRPEAVARGKALLQSGTLGTDAGALADAMIDAWKE